MTSNRQGNEDLVERAVGGDAVALTVLLQQTRRRLVDHLARRIPKGLQSTVEADDIVQEAHAAAFRSVMTLQARGSEAFYRWLATIALRKLRDAIRAASTLRRGAGQTLAAGLSPELEDSVFCLLKVLVSPGKTPSSAAARLEAIQATVSELEQLPEDQRRAVWLVHIEGKTSMEAGQALRRSDAAIRGLCQRGLATLHERLVSSSRFLR